MRVLFSNYLDDQIEKLKEILDILNKKYKYASVLGNDIKGKNFTFSKTGFDISDSNWNERGFVFRVYNGSFYTEVSINNLDKHVYEIIGIIDRELVYAREFSKGFQVNNYPLINEEYLKKDFFDEVSSSFLKKEEEILKRFKSIYEKSFNKSKNLIDMTINVEWVRNSKLFLSDKKFLKQSYIWSQGYQIPVMKKGEDIKVAYYGYSGQKGLEIVSEMENDLDYCLNHTESILNSKKIEPGIYEVICSPEISGLIAHEAFGHGVEMDMFVKKRAKASEYINKYVASNIVNMYDGVKSVKQVSSYLFDDEGVLGNDTKIIDNGVLKNGISDQLTALKLNTLSTGNGKRESYKRKAYSRMTNTFFSSGKDTLENMIKSIKKGYLLLDEISGMEDPKNWGIQCMLLSAQEIKDGELTDNFYSPVIISGYVPELLKNITMISKDFDMFGTGYCGKGYKERVKVSSGGPYIKTKVRLG
ncbi:TldD protein [Oceanotoga teriensis]|uniref:TldD protein n=1 Tax=Oceanotoga teriensis TaxID=515440 RepID=A0AA45HIB9_9BACT|nr:TldD/PmbA family protein [Oceanotoga teriensis]PWJ91268.1 TldD protein [Oceanotoga teriensis]